MCLMYSPSHVTVQYIALLECHYYCSTLTRYSSIEYIQTRLDFSVLTGARTKGLARDTKFNQSVLSKTSLMTGHRNMSSQGVIALHYLHTLSPMQIICRCYVTKFVNDGQTTLMLL